jgi:hypothetical protein
MNITSDRMGKRGQERAREMKGNGGEEVGR